MYLSKMISVFILFLFINVGTGYSVTIKNCDETALSKMAKAYSIISKHVDNIFNVFESKIPEMQSNKQATVRNNLLNYKKRFKRKWPNVLLVCKDDKNMCVKDKFIGRARWPLVGDRGKEVYVCYYDHVSRNLGICDLVNTIVHETGHEISIPKGARHNKAPNENTDPVYIFGNTAEDVCKISDNAPLTGIAERGVGSACYFNDQCMSKKCRKNDEGDKICVF